MVSVPRLSSRGAMKATFCRYNRNCRQVRQSISAIFVAPSSYSNSDALYQATERGCSSKQRPDIAFRIDSQPEKSTVLSNIREKTDEFVGYLSRCAPVWFVQNRIARVPATATQNELGHSRNGVRRAHNDHASGNHSVLFCAVESGREPGTHV